MIPDKAFDGLCCGARAAFHEAWDEAHRMAIGTPDEVDHIYAIVAKGVPALGRAWGAVLKPLGVSLRVTGVFCHQTPKAHFNRAGHGPRSPELADLLVIHEHLPGGTQPSDAAASRMAVLVQAKMTNSGIPSTVDPDQEFLYENWPPFELKGRGPGGVRFQSGLRDIAPNKGGSRYGLIAKTDHLHSLFQRLPYCCGFPTWFVDPEDRIRTAGGEDAGAFVANMLFDPNVPRGRAAARPSRMTLAASPNNHFEVTVEELLTITAKKTLRFKRKAYVTGSRGVPVLACFQKEEFNGPPLPSTGLGFEPSTGGGDADGPPDDAEFDFDDGISILLIETAGGEPSRG